MGYSTKHVNMGGNGTCLHDNENNLVEEERLMIYERVNYGRKETFK